MNELKELVFVICRYRLPVIAYACVAVALLFSTPVNRTYNIGVASLLVLITELIEARRAAQNESDTSFLRRNRTIGEAFSYWKMAYVKLGCQLVLGCGGTAVAGLNDLDWGTFTGTQKVKFFLGITMTGASVILAFVSTTMADLKATDPNQPPKLAPPTPSNTIQNP